MGRFIVLSVLAAACVSSASIIRAPIVNEERSSESTKLAARFVDPPSGFSIDSIGIKGTGCPNGASRVRISDDKKMLQFDYDEWTVKVGPGTEPAQSRLNCAITLGTTIPAGYAFSIAGLTGWQNYNLDAGVTATESALYYFQGQTAQGSQSSTVNGPTGNGRFTYLYSFDQVINSPCGGSSILNVDASLRITSSNSGSGTATRTWNKIELQWIRC